MCIVPRHSVNLSIKLIASAFFNSKLKKELKKNYLQSFQEKFADLVGVKFSLGVSSARCGLYLLLKSLDLKAGDEIILSAYNFHPILIMVKMTGYKPVFIDIKRNTGNIDADKIEKAITSKTRGIIVTHMSGFPADIEKIISLANRHKLFVIEDCAHALGAKFKDRPVGSFADAGIFSFSYGKMLPCLGGGMITTNRSDLFNKLKKEVDSSRPPARISQFKKIIKTFCYYILTKKYIFSWTVYPFLLLIDRICPDFIERNIQEKADYNPDSYKYDRIKMSSFQAKTGLLQLERLDELLRAVARNSEDLNKALSDAGIESVKKLPNTDPAYLYYQILVGERDKVKSRLLRRGVDSKKDDMSTPDCLDIFEEKEENYPIAKSFSNSKLEIPNGALLGPGEVKYIAEAVREVVKLVNK